MRTCQSSVTSKGQVTIPVDVRKRLGLETPDKVIFVADEAGVHLKPVEVTLASLFGSVPALPGTSEDFEAEIEEAMAAEFDRQMREGRVF